MASFINCKGKITTLQQRNMAVTTLNELVLPILGQTNSVNLIRCPEKDTTIMSVIFLPKINSLDSNHEEIANKNQN